MRWQHLYVSRYKCRMLWTWLGVRTRGRDGYHNNSTTVHDLKTRAAAKKRATGAPRLQQPTVNKTTTQRARNDRLLFGMRAPCIAFVESVRCPPKE